MAPRPLRDGFQNARTSALRALEELFESVVDPELDLHRRPDTVLRLRGPHQVDRDAVTVEDGVVGPVKALVHQGCFEAADLLVSVD